MTKEFNLQDWQSSKYDVITRNGNKVFGLHYFDYAKGDFCLAGVIDKARGISTWTSTGKFNIENVESPFDLVLVIPEMWVNVYSLSYDDEIRITQTFATKDEAELKIIKNTNYLGTFKLVKDGE